MASPRCPTCGFEIIASSDPGHCPRCQLRLPESGTIAGDELRRAGRGGGSPKIKLQRKVVSAGVKIPTLPQDNEAPSQVMCPACGLINKINSTKGLDLVKCNICGCEIEL